MRLGCKQLLCSLAVLMSWPLCAQDLAPRAYVITPVHSNAVTLTWSYYNGGVNFNGAIPITGATGTFSVSDFYPLPFLQLLRTFSECDGFFAVRCWNLSR
jgi:hypothetical protein